MIERSNAKNRIINISKVYLAKEQLGRIVCSLFGGEANDGSGCNARFYDSSRGRRHRDGCSSVREEGFGSDITVA